MSEYCEDCGSELLSDGTCPECEGEPDYSSRQCANCEALMTYRGNGFFECLECGEDYDSWYESDYDNPDYGDYTPPRFAAVRRIVHRIQWWWHSHTTRCADCGRIIARCDCIPF